MPSHHHRETNRCCCGCSIHSSPPPHLTTSDQVLQALASHLLLQYQKPPTVSDRHCLKPQQHPPLLHSFFQIHQLGDDHLPPAPPHYHRHEQQQQQRFYQYQAQPLIDSLLRRVAALESSFPHLSPTSSPSPPVDPRSQTRPTSIPDTSPRKPWIFSFDWMSSMKANSFPGFLFACCFVNGIFRGFSWLAERRPDGSGREAVDQQRTGPHVGFHR
ncbi:unnamed protein product [Musa banksii]